MKIGKSPNKPNKLTKNEIVKKVIPMIIPHLFKVTPPLYYIICER